MYTIQRFIDDNLSFYLTYFYFLITQYVFIQLISYAGYKNADGSITGDPINVEITEVRHEMEFLCSALN